MPDNWLAFRRWEWALVERWQPYTIACLDFLCFEKVMIEVRGGGVKGCR
jgi:hypothetical protein